MIKHWMALGVAGLLWGSAADVQSRGPDTGPVVEAFGPVFEVPGAFGLVPGQAYRAVMDVAGAAGAADELNRELESAARYLNMHVRAGMDAADLELAVVLHGGATDAALNDVAYRARHGVDNPNRGLLAGLAAAGARIYLCGQSAGFRGIAPAELAKQVELATSAMTVLVRLQAEGYALLP